MSLEQILIDLRADFGFMENVTTWQTLPARNGRFERVPSSLHPAIETLLAEQGITQLYSHQAQSIEAALSGQNLVVVTPTASGKTLCYNLPVLHSLLNDPGARALYLFPTKALAQDQLANLGNWAAALPNADTLTPHSYDGDTPSGQRAEIRRSARIILSNPDMLHTGILPYHPNWHDFFANLRYVVIDELHIYRGVFGSHVANVLRRLQRICNHYGSSPQFICTSATIANPQTLAENLLEQPVTLIDQNGAPSGEKQVIFYNPPCYDQERGLRRAATLEAQELAARLVLGDIQTILFGRSRLATEVMLTYLRERVERSPGQSSGGVEWRSRGVAKENDINDQIRGYRGGYLAEERREIEAGLRSGDVRAVVATNALELGIDIGQLQAAVLCGYPGSIASTWQQMGRSGRTTESALAILVATSGVLDQYVIQHPEFVFEQPPEYANINPDNLMLLVDHVRCAAFELPFVQGDRFGKCDFVDDALSLLTEQGELDEAAGRYFWNGESYPARQVNLRSSGSETVVIQSTPEPTAEFSGVQIIGELDLESAVIMLHEGAIYIHEGRTYRVETLDLENFEAHVTPVNVDYYTDVRSETEIAVLEQHAQAELAGAVVNHGEVEVTSQVVSYRRVKRYTHENLGTTPLDYPPQSYPTNAYWFSLTEAALEALIAQGDWMDSPNDYGPNWQAQRKRVRHRDGYKCSRCGTPEPTGRQHDVHHVVPFRTFGYVPGMNENYKEANHIDNLALLCRRCHQVVEAGVRVRGGLDGLAYTLQNLAPLYLMCDRSDIGVSFDRGERSPDSGFETPIPTIYVYERAIAGLGFSSRLFELHEEMLNGAYTLIQECPCTVGCPACVGPILDNHIAVLETKELTLSLLRGLLGLRAPAPRESATRLQQTSELDDVVF